jgi:hypothetical protein
VKAGFPLWFRIFISFCWISVVATFAFFMFKTMPNGLSWSEIKGCLIFIVIIAAGFWVIARFLFYSVTSTEDGLETNNLFHQCKLLPWDEIVEVRRPRFGIPYDFSYVVSRGRHKMLLIRSMRNYQELIDVIRARAGNLIRCSS